MKILDYFILQMVTNVIKGSFPISKVLVFEGNSYVCWKNEDIRLFYSFIANGKLNVIKGSFPISKEKMKILDYFISNGKECN